MGAASSHKRVHSPQGSNVIGRVTRSRTKQHLEMAMPLPPPAKNQDNLPPANIVPVSEPQPALEEGPSGQHLNPPLECASPDKHAGRKTLFVRSTYDESDVETDSDLESYHPGVHHSPTTQVLDSAVKPASDERPGDETSNVPGPAFDQPSQEETKAPII